MVITYQGENYFRFQSGDLTLLVDPTNQRAFKGASVVLCTTSPASSAPPEESGDEAPFWVDHPGEYEAKGIEIRGISTGNDGRADHTAYRVTMDEITIGLLGHLTADLDEPSRELLGGVDILILPAGGKPYLSEAAAAKIARELEPSLVIPSLTDDPRTFLKALGVTAAEEEKLVLKKKDLAPGALIVKRLQHA